MSSDYAIVLADMTGEECSEADLEHMRKEIEEVVNRYGFKLQVYGSEENVRRMMVDKTRFLEERGYG